MLPPEILLHGLVPEGIQSWREEGEAIQLRRLLQGLKYALRLAKPLTCCAVSFIHSYIYRINIQCVRLGWAP